MGNTINCSKFLKEESGLRASPEAVTKFKEELEKHGRELTQKCKELVEKKNKKTIQLREITEALEK